MSTISSDEPEAVKLLRGQLSKRATSAEFNEWQAREVVAYIDSLLSLRESHPIEDGEGWIEWKGGECPVPGKHVYYKTDNGTPEGWAHEGTQWVAEHLNWSWDDVGQRSRIIAYRIIPSNPGTSKVENSRST